MKKIIAWLLVLSLTAAISIGATLAYLTDTDEDVNVMTLGKVKIDQLEYERIDDETANEKAEVQEFHDNKPLYPAVTGNGFDYTPGDTKVDWTQIGKDGYTSEIWNPENINNELDKMVFIKNKGDYDAFVRTVFAFEAGNYTTLDQFKSMMHLNLNSSDFTWEWVETPVTIGASTYFVATATYNKVLAPGALTEISLSQIALDKTATNADVEAFGETYQILVKSQGIQADGFENAADALDEGFGEITATNIPWENDNPNKGGDLTTALHYLNADPTGTEIVTSITSIVFGKTSEYPAIANNYKGYLIDVEQDTDAYAYYVDNGAKAADSTYTIYVLSDDVIYAPKNCLDLFRNMNQLVSINAEKLDVSRVETMENMFRSAALKTVNVTGWDVSNVTNLYGTFLNCTSLESIVGLETWDVSAVTTTNRLFSQCPMLKEIDLSTWKLPAVTDAERMFYKCEVLEELDASNWDLRNLVNARDMFKYCYKLKQIKGMGNWKTGNVESLWDTFALCWSLETLEGLQNWDLSSAIKVAGTFQQCLALTDEDVAVLYNWDTSNFEDISWLFKGATGLVNLDLSNWDVSNVTKFNSLFSSSDSNSGSMNIKTTGIENWDVGNGDNLSYMFYGCGQLESIDLSNWDVSKNTTFNHFFTDCYKLKYVNFDGWDTSSCEVFAAMFNNCDALEYVDVSSFDTQNAYAFHQMFEYCYNLKKIDGLQNWDTRNVEGFYEMFSCCYKLEELDLSSFVTTSLTDTYRNFNACSSLKTIYVGDGWDMSKVTSSAAMFSGCNNLVGGAGTAFQGSDLKYAHVDGGAENPGYLTYKAPETTNP